ncbi:MAG TPA: acyl-CoA dehydrogenase family protein, partial [Bryobacteraceae bacterium]|nr:acyl-CoA dehydrogenase family protein [Bryobacteraceae bacterium]
LSTAMALANHGDGPLKERFLPHLLRRDAGVWQGATWMTEAGGGSDLGATVETVARRHGERWLLTGDKYFASNVGAELAIVAARPEGAPAGVRGLALFLVPRLREDGTLNYRVRRLKEKIATRSVPTGEVELRASEAFLLGKPAQGIYLILEALNLSRAANSMGSVALAQRAMKEALAFASERRAFGKPLLEHPLMRKQFEGRLQALRAALALAWESVRRLEEVRTETAPYSERYHAFRLIAHLAKYWTAELAAQTAKWAMEVHGGAGALTEYPVERWLREAMILAIWEGPAHRQILDGLETMERFHAHRTILEDLAKDSSRPGLDAMGRRIEDHLALDATEREARAEELFRELAVFIGESLLNYSMPA